MRVCTCRSPATASSCSPTRSLQPLAGNLSAWPRNLPVAPGNYRIKVDMGEKGIQETLVHVALLGR